MVLFDGFFRKKEKEQQADRGTTVLCPVKGEVIPLKDVEDDAFASGMMGPGAGIRPENGMIYAPVSGEVCVAFHTGHAIGIRSEAGVELLIHIGINTVNMNGEGFMVHVKQGDLVQAGDLIAEFDPDKVMAAGYKTTVMLLVTNAGDECRIDDVRTGSAQVKEPIFTVN